MRVSLETRQRIGGADAVTTQYGKSKRRNNEHGCLFLHQTLLTTAPSAVPVYDEHHTKVPVYPTASGWLLPPV